MMRFWGIVAAATMLTAVGCSRDRAPEYAPEMDSIAEEMAEPAPAPPSASRAVAAELESMSDKGGPGGFGGAPARQAKKAKPQAPADDEAWDGDEAEGGESTGGESADESTTTPAPKKRMVHYNGYCKLRVTKPEDVLARAVAIAEKAEGYVESYSSISVTLRVPVASFQAIYDQVVKLGDVVARSITAQDVTDAFTAIELRLKTLRASRDRLITLLAKVHSEQEKLTLLREIRRLTETIDQLALQLDTIASLANFSRITVEAEPRHTDPGRSAEEMVGAFRWIRDLSPFRRDVAELGEVLELTAPEGMVALDSESLWSAEGPDGAVIWTHRRDNRPEGTTDYWVGAIRARLAVDFAEATMRKVGGYSVLRLVDGGPTAYRYLIAVSARGEDLDVVEIYFPSEEQEKRYTPAIEAVLGKGGAS